ncbi:ISAs1 family transposase [Vibrio sp. 10N.286.48.C11]|uniref:ISAs1 family transposase n=1 Tax=Vibrio sp. 10N.286.48.C11 TaxID=3229698 RepID=UPI0035543441
MLYQQSTHGKGKEISLCRDVLDALVLKDAIVTLDSLHCLAPTMAQITEKNGDFTIQLKKNQPNLFEHVKEAFSAVYNQPENMAECTQKNEGHGRKECRNIVSAP